MKVQPPCRTYTRIQLTVKIQPLCRRYTRIQLTVKLQSLGRKYTRVQLTVKIQPLGRTYTRIKLTVKTQPLCRTYLYSTYVEIQPVDRTYTQVQLTRIQGYLFASDVKMYTGFCLDDIPLIQCIKKKKYKKIQLQPRGHGHYTQHTHVFNLRRRYYRWR